MPRRAGIACLLAFTSLLASSGVAGRTPADDAFRDFWATDDQRAAARAATRILDMGLTADEIERRLAEGPQYAADVPRGEVTWQARGPGGAPLPTTVVVPKEYDPSVRYPVRVFLHGGVGREMPAEGPRAPRRRLESGQSIIHVYPTGFADAQWWGAAQVDNLARVIARLKRTYNVDENRIHLLGVSDGGTGVYFFGMRDATTWSVLFPFNGAMRVLTNPAVGADGDLYASNLAVSPVFAINGGRDPLYPVAAVVKYLALLERSGVRLEFRPHMEAGHDTSWWPEERARVDEFERAHPRDPLPDRLSWTTERTDRYNRCRWLVIDALDANRGTPTLEDPNTIEYPQPYDFGFRIDSKKDDPLRVVDVIAGTDAAAMGLRKNDVLRTIDGRAIRVADDIGQALAAHAVRGPLAIVVERGGTAVTLETMFPPQPKPPVREPAFPRRRPWGRVDLARTGNVVEARTRGVAAFTLLLSSRRFDLSKPVKVVVDGAVAFDGPVAKDARTMLEWAARDRDRTAIFATALKVDVPRRASGDGR